MSLQDGFVIIDKPAGITSHDVVAKLRKSLGTKQVGHAGTLDPMATGVLVLGVNKATKFLQYITQGKKAYHAQIRLGQVTTSDDAQGEITSTSDTSNVSDQEIRDFLATQVGSIMQVPTKVSAIKINGQRAYDLVREGKEVDIPSRQIDIYMLDVIEIKRGEFLDIEISVECSAGTYIRSIARDLGSSLGVGGHLISLRRSLVAPFSLSDCSGLESPVIRPLASEISKVMRVRDVDLQEVKELSFGRSLSASSTDGPVVALAPDGQVAAILENREHGAQPVAVFIS
jgi:tRNA pseudouridine55 synthase